MNIFRRTPKESVAVAELPPTPRFVCRTCGGSNSFYVARRVVNWAMLGSIFRREGGEYTCRTLNVYLPGEPGPPLRYCCTTCYTAAATLGELLRDTTEDAQAADSQISPLSAAVPESSE